MDSFDKKSKILSARDHFRNFGEIGILICSLDWSQTSLGPIDTWSASLITTVGITLTSSQPSGILWGSDSIFIYNDAFKFLLGFHHPKALGQPYFDYLKEDAIITKQMIEVAMESQTSVRCREDQQFILEKEHGIIEETYLTLYVSPIFNEFCSVGGFLISGTDTTKGVLALRRSTLLRELNLANEKTIYRCCQSISRVFNAFPSDIPFALVYLFEKERPNTLILQSFTGIVAGTKASPLEVEIEPNIDATTNWPFYRALNCNPGVLVDDLNSRFGEDWTLSPARALVIPINVDDRVKNSQGVIVLGICPATKVDDEYRFFTRQIIFEMNNVLLKAHLLEGNTLKTQEMASISQEKTDFFTNVSHEFRTPLSLMLGPLADSLNDKENSLSPVQRDRLLMIQRNSLRLVKLVNSILDFSRIEAGASKMTYRPTDLSKLTQEIASLFESAMIVAGLEFVVNIEPINQPVYVDPEMWEKIIMNLISNAFKFTFKGKIEITLRRHANDVILEVIDTGVGIHEEDMKNIFKRFHQTDKTKGRSSEGSGIGLSLIYELVKLHYGIISVKSKLHCGTTFTVTIPMAPKSTQSPNVTETPTDFKSTEYSKGIVEEVKGWTQEATTPKEESIQVATDNTSQTELLSNNPSRSKSAILLAEDNTDMRKYIRGVLIKHWNLEVTSNGLDAYELACANEFQVIISDVMMPKLDGFGLIQMIRNNPKTRGIPIILLTSRAGEGALVQGFEFGADDYLVKTSFSEKELVARVKKHIELGLFRRYLEHQVEEKADELHKLNSAYYEFIDMLCHEIRNPLHGISGNWELLMDRFSSLESVWKSEFTAANKNMSEIQQSLITYLSEMKSYLINIEVCTVHQTQVIDEVVLRAKLQRNNYQVTHSVCNPVTLIKETIKRFEKITASLGFTVKIVSDSTDARILMIDVHCVKQILGNLLGMVIRNMEKDGVISINHSFKDESNISFELKCSNLKSDVTVDEDELSLDNMTLAVKSMGEHYNNAGFGISICNKLISLIGGEPITVTKQEENGICLNFIIFGKPLPQEKNTILEDEEKPVASDLVKKIPKLRVPTKRVLVAEDNIINQTLCKALLAKQGYQCVIARDGREALEKFVPEAYDFILMDISMPELNGFEVTKRIREIEAAMEIDNPVSIIGLSAYARQENINAAVEAGMDDFISKPATFAKIVKIIQSRVEGGSARKSNEDLFQQNSGMNQVSSLEAKLKPKPKPKPK